MRAFLKLGLLVLLSAAFCFGQSPPPITAQSVTFPISANLAPVTSAAVAVVGNPGPQTYFYWLVTNYTLGASSPVFVGLTSNAPNVLSGSTYVRVTPAYVSGILSVDLLRTASAVQPTGACACAVAMAVTSGSINDQSNSLSAYTVNPFFPANFGLTIDNEVISAGVTHLILRQGPLGTFVADLSTVGAGSVSGSGTAATIPLWSAGTVLGNSPLTVSGGVVNSSDALNVAASVTATALTMQPLSALGGSTANNNIFGFLNDSNTAPVLNIDTPGVGAVGPQQSALRIGTNGFSQFQVCNFGNGGAAQGGTVFGSAVACPSIYTTLFAKAVFQAATATHGLIRTWHASASQTAPTIQINAATAAGTGFNDLEAWAGVTGTDTFHTGGTQTWSIRHDGAFTASQYIGNGAFLVTSGAPGSNFSPTASKSSVAIQNDFNLYFSANGGTFGQIPFLGGQVAANQLAIGSGSGTFATSTIPNCTAATCALGYNNTTQTWSAQGPFGTGTGSVTSVASGGGLQGGPITTSGTLSIVNGTQGCVLYNTNGTSGYATACPTILSSVQSGADPSLRVQTIVNAMIATTLPSTQVIDMRNDAGAWSDDPVWPAVGNGFSPAVGGVILLPCGTVTLQRGSPIPGGWTYIPCGRGSANIGTYITTGGSFPATNSTGTCSNPQSTIGGASGAGAQFANSYGFVATCTGAAFSASLRGSYYGACDGTNVTGTACGGTTGSGAQGTIVGVTGNTTLYVITENNTSKGGANASAVNFVITTPMFPLGDSSGGGSDSNVGVHLGSIDIEGTIDTNGVAGSAPIVNMSCSNNCTVGNWVLNPSTGPAIAIWGNQPQNSAWYGPFWVTKGAGVCTGNAMGGQVRSAAAEIFHFMEGSSVALATCNSGAGVAYGVQIDAGGTQLAHMHIGLTSSGTTGDGVAVGTNPTCSPVCYWGAGTASGVAVSDINGFNQGGNLVHFGSPGSPVNFSASSIKLFAAGWTNLFLDDNKPCTIPNGTVYGTSERSLNAYLWNSGSGDFFSTSSVCGGFHTNGPIVAGSYNGLMLSTTTGTFTLTNAKTFAVQNSLTLAGTDGQTETFPSVSVTVAGNASATAHAIGLYEGAATAQNLLSCGLGTVLNGAASADPTCTVTPTLGGVGAGTGSITAAGNTSGSISFGCAGASCTSWSTTAAIKASAFNTATNCVTNSGCGSATAGMAAIAAAATTVTVSTTAVTANSEIRVQFDATVGGASQLNVTCNTGTSTGFTYWVSTRTPGTSFVISTSTTPVTNPACVTWSIVN